MNEGALQHLDIRVHGLVQGIGFRATSRARAAGLGLSGFVRNEPDGTVYIEVEGPEPALTDFCEWCRRGPPGAEVERVEAIPGTLRNLHGFNVRFH